MSNENADTRFELKQLEIARQKGIIEPDEEVRAFVSLFNRSQAVALSPILARFLLKKFLFVVTDQRVLLMTVPAFAVHGGGYHKWVEHPLPCKLELEREPKEFHQTGNKVRLPDHLASFVGRPNGFVLRGKAAQQAFQLASNPASSPSTTSTVGV